MKAKIESQPEEYASYYGAIGEYKANYAVMILETDIVEKRRYEIAGQNVQKDLKEILPLSHSACGGDCSTNSTRVACELLFPHISPGLEKLRENTRRQLSTIFNSK